VIAVTQNVAVDALKERPGAPWRPDIIIGPFPTEDAAYSFARTWQEPDSPAATTTTTSVGRRYMRAREIIGDSGIPVRARSRRPGGGATEEEERELLPPELVPMYNDLVKRSDEEWTMIPSFVPMI
jgi:hypothetical protein